MAAAGGGGHDPGEQRRWLSASAAAGLFIRRAPIISSCHRRTRFNGPQEWAATALHELGHWTGHKDRLNRDLSGRFGSGSYAQEELRAELARPLSARRSVCRPTSRSMPAISPTGSRRSKTTSVKSSALPPTRRRSPTWL